MDADDAPMPAADGAISPPVHDAAAGPSFEYTKKSQSHSDGMKAAPLLSSVLDGTEFCERPRTWTVHCGHAFAGHVSHGIAREQNEAALVTLARDNDPAKASHASRSVRSWWLLSDVRVKFLGRRSGQRQRKPDKPPRTPRPSTPLGLDSSQQLAERGVDVGDSGSSASAEHGETKEAKFESYILDKVVSALHKGSEAPARSWLGLGRDPNMSDSFGNPLMHAACASGALALLQLVLDKGGLPGYKGQSGQEALHVAAIHGQPEAVAMLIRVGADVNATNAFGATPLMLCAARGSTSVVPLLLEAGAVIALRDEAGLTAAM